MTPSHHSSRNSRSRSAQSNPSSGNTGSRSQTLTEEGNPFTPSVHTPRPWMPHEHYTPRQGTLIQGDYPQEWIEGRNSGKYLDTPWYNGWKRGEQPILNPDWVEPESLRAAARREALDSPLAPRSSAIPQEEIASYPREWHDGARSGKYSYIPSYQGWRRGEQPELAQPERSSLPDFMGRPPDESPGPSTRTEPIERPTFEGPHQSSRVQQQVQQPDNVYGDDPFVDRLTDSQWEQIMQGQIPRPSDPETTEKATLLRSYVSHQPVPTQDALE